MARRKVSILKERKMKLSSQVEILNDIYEMIDFKTKDSEKKFLDKKLRLEIRLEEVKELLEEEVKVLKPAITNKELFNMDDKGLTKSEKDSDVEMSDARGIGDH